MTRLDAALAARGLARSRTHAAHLISEGLVTVDGRGVVKSSAQVTDDADIHVAGADHYVSRAAHKLLAALDAFAVSVDGRLAVDMGASTGGFTQVLRERGARPVLALDVGHGQLSPQIAADPEVRRIVGFNVRYMTRAVLTDASGTDDTPGIVTGDLSFISLTHVLPAVAEIAGAETDVILLVKPQFEVGRGGVREGVVTDPGRRVDAVTGVLWSAWDAGLGTVGVISSPIVGTHGNAEFLVHLRPDRAGMDAGNPTEWLADVERCVRG